ncbi:hypothetical protein EDB86DRAFT_2936860 [Lactarius hatsudake]|nr:hypothetical protein EDB86DRAFT_2936860 [Lactarius hatsudake]
MGGPPRFITVVLFACLAAWHDNPLRTQVVPDEDFGNRAVTWARACRAGPNISCRFWLGAATPAPSRSTRVIWG